jgi:secreted PhoX family phosphatase
MAVGLAVDNSGNLYSGCPGSSTVTKWTKNGIGSYAGFADSVSGLAFDRADNLYMTVPNYVSVCRGYFTADCNQSYLANPTSLVFDKAGNIFVANGVSAFPFGGNNQYTNTIAKFSNNLTYLGDFATNLNKPWGLAFDRAGNLFVSNSGNNRIYKFTSNGAPISQSA